MNKILTKVQSCIILASLALVYSPLPVEANPSPKQLLQMIEAQQKQLDALKAALLKAEAQAQTAAKKAESASIAMPKLPKGLSIGGALEIEASASDTYAGVNSTDLALAKAELFVDAQPHDLLGTHIQLLYEDGSNNITLDEAIVSIGDPEKFPLYLNAGQFAVPFGGFDTAMNSDPLSKTLGETAEGTILVGYKFDEFTLEGYVYNGDTQKAGDEDEIDQFGFSASMESEVNGMNFSGGMGYISNITDASGLGDNVTGNTALNSYIEGFEVHGSLTNGPFTFYAGYMAALDTYKVGELAFNGVGASPETWNVEGAYTIPVQGKETTIAFTVQGSEEALAVALPETRIGAAVTVQALDNVSVTGEYIHDEDYDVDEGGTGNDKSTFTLKMAVEF
ncbi:MAG: LbtU family siderophore porin [Pseudomonadota bacterium]|nr:LbtU family siderophore porin [Pseudomonadota bacterium]